MARGRIRHAGAGARVRSASSVVVAVLTPRKPIQPDQRRRNPSGPVAGSRIRAQP
jgi:hypothetical protein